MSARAFVDTNILVYAHDRGSGERHRKASDLLADLWRDRTGVLSTQILQELYVNIRRKARQPVSAAEAKQILADYQQWQVVVNDGASILRAVDLEERYSLSFWDALVVQAAQRADVETLYTEDLSHGQLYGSVKAIDPFRAG